MKPIVLLYPKPGRRLRALLSDQGWDWHHRGLWVVDTEPGAGFTVDLDRATIAIRPDDVADGGADPPAGERVTVPLYGLFAAVGDRLYARVDARRDGVLTGARDERVSSIRPCRRIDPLGASLPGVTRWRAERAASRLPPPWRFGPARPSG